jgi:hypothetical protein
MSKNKASKPALGIPRAVTFHVDVEKEIWDIANHERITFAQAVRRAAARGAQIIKRELKIAA